MFEDFYPRSKKKSVDDVLAAFNSAISDLDTVSQREASNADRLEEEAANKITQANAARAEAERARGITKNLRSLVLA